LTFTVLLLPNQVSTKETKNEQYGKLCLYLFGILLRRQ